MQRGPLNPFGSSDGSVSGAEAMAGSAIGSQTSPIPLVDLADFQAMLSANVTFADRVLQMNALPGGIAVADRLAPAGTSIIGHLTRPTISACWSNTPLPMQPHQQARVQVACRIHALLFVAPDVTADDVRLVTISPPHEGAMPATHGAPTPSTASAPPHTRAPISFAQVPMPFVLSQSRLITLAATEDEEAKGYSPPPPALQQPSFVLVLSGIEPPSSGDGEDDVHEASNLSYAIVHPEHVLRAGGLRWQHAQWQEDCARHAPAEAAMLAALWHVRCLFNSHAPLKPFAFLEYVMGLAQRAEVAACFSLFQYSLDTPAVINRLLDPDAEPVQFPELARRPPTARLEAIYPLATAAQPAGTAAE
ncbi:hypothetical protein EON66_07555 [archaeon]|nr:MAG: hypothetical protein EON66_07555 [archaeon]